LVKQEYFSHLQNREFLIKSQQTDGFASHFGLHKFFHAVVHQFA